MRISEGMAAFHNDLYEEHLEEAAFLYEQRVLLSGDPGVDWPDVADEEARLEAHLDALRIGGEWSRQARQAAMKERDPGYCHALVSLFCLEEDFEGLTGYLGDRELDEKSSQALVAALLAYCPEAWHGPLMAAVADQSEAVAVALIRFAGIRRLPEAVLHLERLSHHPDLFGEVALARARLGARAALPDLQLICQTEGPDATRASLALLCLGDRSQLDVLERSNDPEQIARFAISLGSAGSGGPLSRAWRSGQRNPEILIAMGLSGEPAGVETLIEALESAELAEAAAVALYLITGLDEREEVFVPDEPGEEDSEEEPLGEELRRLTQSPATWRRWWRENGRRFDRGLVYRLGEPIAPRVVLESLAAASTPNRLRRWIALELQIRYGLVVDLDPAMSIDRQRRVLMRAREEAARAEFEAGRRYLFGQPA